MYFPVSKALFLYCTLYRVTVFALHSLEMHCVFTAHCRGSVCLLHSLEWHSVCTAQCGVALYVYCII